MTPSEFLAKTLSIIYPAPFRVIPHGVAPFTPLPKSPSATLRFGYVGSLLPQKGWQILVKAFADLKIPPEVATLDLFGGDQNIVHPGIRFRGVYNKSDLPKICSEIDVAIIPSLFAETFSLVLSELWMGSVPTAASRIGAFQERIHEGTNGKLFTPGDISNLQETIGWFINDTSWRGWKLPQPKSVSTMANEYHTLYRELLNG